VNRQPETRSREEIEAHEEILPISKIPAIAKNPGSFFVFFDFVFFDFVFFDFVFFDPLRALRVLTVDT
jgi:hypothetical protein